MSLSKALTAAAGNAAGESLYVEDVFSTYLYTGNSSANTLPNGIDLAGEGGLIWIKQRDLPVYHGLFDTIRGGRYALYSNTTNANIDWGSNVVDFGTTGQTINNFNDYNNSGKPYASWTFRKAEKFFDVVTYTGDGVAGRAVPHNLNGTAGFAVVKRTDSGTNWEAQHRSIDLSSNKGLYLNLTDGVNTHNNVWNSTHATSTDLILGNHSDVNGVGGSYVAYLFAHDAGGFGDDGSESIIKCGSYTGNGGSQEINLGFEPQWVMVKRSNSTGFWHMFDVMRGMPVEGNNSGLTANTSNAEGEAYKLNPTSTGFEIRSEATTEINANGSTYIYIAIRRPMKTPESGTEVFSPVYTSSTTDTKLTTNFPVDMQIYAYTGGPYSNTVDRLRGVSSTNETYSTPHLQTSTTGAESLSTGITNGFDNTGFKMLAGYSGYSTIFWSFKRATGFFDVVAYTGGGSSVYKYKHNLGVAPELIIIKSRSNGTNVNYWPVKIRSVAGQKPLALNSASANPLSSTSYWSSFTDTATEFATRASSSAYDVNATGYTYIAYLFASVAGVSKVGSYTGTGSNVDVDCGFSAGARFILIKRTDSTGDWYVWDSARGIVAGNDPYLLLNSTAAEVTSTDYIDPLASGFTVTSSAPAALNASGGTYIFLATA